ncbi:hypothetical protein BDN72DRAFT_891283 [Pluteus cervinus]|uniref:Uncharacterized protein n=1 Tax=Pluteus cervinus TaxID=181527 RepID=A0ACD3BGP5_9AGAR|nr:hypothetical protein BDN72DRAFT_891283 [Pluteus cervinus]
MSLRSSTRLKEKNARSITPKLPPEPLAIEDEEELSVKLESEDERPASKRRRGASKQVQKASGGPPASSSTKRRSGKLGQMTEMPLDILYETFSHLQPLDLLHLSRANKELRYLLLTRTALAVWKAAFINADPRPPACPPALNHTQYANLLYGHHCQYCASQHGNIAVWAVYVRCCAKCLSIHFVPPVYDDELEKQARLLSTRWYVKSGKHDKFVYLKKEVDEVREKYLELRQDKDAFEAWKRTMRQSKDQHTQLGGSLAIWCDRVKQKRLKELDQARVQRVEEILARLEALGWGEELELHPVRTRLINLPALKQSRELTDRIWENIKPGLVEFLEQSKATRLQNDRRYRLGLRVRLLYQVFDQYVRELPPRTVTPGPADLASTVPFRRLILETPLDENLAIGDFADLIDELPNLCLSWEQSKNKFLSSLIPAGKRSRVKGLRSFDLATTFFRCAWCRDPIAYPRVLVHDCLSKVHSSTQINEEDEELFAILEETPWNYGDDSVTFDEEASIAAHAIITAVNKDPRTTTPQEMDDLDPRIECIQCTTPRSKLAMRWRTAILHTLSIHDCVDETNWVLLNASEANIAKGIEAKHMPRWRSDVACAICRTPTTRKDFGLHYCKYRTDKTDPGARVYVPLDVPMNQPPYAVKIPV